MTKPRSKCCFAPVYIASSDEGTHYHVCSKCGCDCDIVKPNKVLRSKDHTPDHYKQYRKAIERVRYWKEKYEKEREISSMQASKIIQLGMDKRDLRLMLKVKCKDMGKFPPCLCNLCLSQGRKKT